ncbi:hypothetical protein AAG906_018318 [Vitis piasezkii]
MLKSIKILLSIVVHLNYKILQIDVKTAFLNSDIEESIYMMQSDEFILNKPTYRLKQAYHSWNKCFNQNIKTIDFDQNEDKSSSAMGSLTYAMLCTRSYICFIVGMMSRYQSNPSMENWIMSPTKGSQGKLVHFHGWKSLALPTKTTKLCILALGTFPGNLSSKELEKELLSRTGSEQISGGLEPFQRRMVSAKFRRHPRGSKYFRNTKLSLKGCKLASTLRFQASFSRHKSSCIIWTSESAPKVAATTVIKNMLNGRFSLLFLLAIQIYS